MKVVQAVKDVKDVFKQRKLFLLQCYICPPSVMVLFSMYPQPQCLIMTALSPPKDAKLVVSRGLLYHNAIVDLGHQDVGCPNADQLVGEPEIVGNPLDHPPSGGHPNDPGDLPWQRSLI